MIVLSKVFSKILLGKGNLTESPAAIKSST